MYGNVRTLHYLIGLSLVFLLIQRIFPHEMQKVILREVRFNPHYVRLNTGELEISSSE